MGTAKVGLVVENILLKKNLEIALVIILINKSNDMIIITQNFSLDSLL